MRCLTAGYVYVPLSSVVVDPEDVDVPEVQGPRFERRVGRLQPLRHRWAPV